MKKREVRWISRDKEDDSCEIWAEEPNKKLGWWRGRSYMNRVSRFRIANCLRIKIKCGGLAKVIIERQY